MAMTVTLGPASGGALVLTDHTKHGLAGNGLRLRPTREYIRESLPDIDGSRLVSHRATEMELTAMLHLAGTSHDNLIANWRNVQDMLRKAALYAEENIGEPIEFRYKWNNATNVVVFDVLSGQMTTPVVDDTGLISSYLFDTPLVLICQPYARDPSLTTLTLASSGNYAAWAPTAITGDVRPPARLRIRNQSSGTYDYIRVAMRSRGTVANFISRYEPGRSAPTGYTITRPSSRAAANADGLHLDVTYASNLSDGLMEGAYSGPTLGSELVSNGTFATGAGGLGAAIEPAAGWFRYGLASATSAGTFVIAAGSSDGRLSFFYQNVPVVAGQSYRFSISMLNSVAQGSGTGAKVALIGAGISTTPHPDIAPGEAAPDGSGSITTNYGAITSGYSKVLVESGTGATTHTWDFVAEKSFVQVRLYNDGNGTATFDNASLKTVKARAAGWSVSGGVIGNYEAVDNEGETAGSRVYQGSSAQGFGTGDASLNFLSHSFTMVSGVTYRVSAQMKRTGGTNNVNLIVFDSFSPVVPLASLVANSPTLTTVEGTFVAPSTAGLIILYCGAGTGGIVDNIIITPNDNAQNELVRFTVTTNIADFQGQFRVYARCRTQVNPFELQIRSGGPNGNRSAADSVTVTPVAGATTNYQVVSLGRVNIPERDMPFGQAMSSFSFGIWLVPTAMGDVSASSTLEIWDVELVPIDEAFWELIAPSGQGPAGNEYAIIDTQARIPLTYLADSSGNHKASLPHGGSRLQLPIGTFRVYVHVAQSVSNDPVGGTNNFSADINYYPRFDVFR